MIISIAERINREVAHVLLCPLVAVVHYRSRGDVVKNHGCQSEPLRGRQRFNHLAVNFFSSRLRRHLSLPYVMLPPDQRVDEPPVRILDAPCGFMTSWFLLQPPRRGESALWLSGFLFSCPPCLCVSVVFPSFLYYRASFSASLYFSLANLVHSAILAFLNS
jgi:hypothetical protein